MRHPRALPAAAAALALAALVGCGSSEPGTPAPAGGAPSGSAEPAGPTRYATLPELTAALTERSLADETSAYEFTTIGPQLVTGGGVARIDDAGRAHRTTSQVAAPDGTTSDVTVVVLDQDMFVQLPPGAEVEPGKPWVRVQPGGSDPISQAFGPLAEQSLSSATPVEQLETNEEAYTLTGVTEEERGGRTALRYAVDVDVDVLTQRLAERSGTDPLPVAPASTSTASYLVDADDRLLEAVSTVTVEGQTVETATTFSGWGEPVDITPPPAELVATG